MTIDTKRLKTDASYWDEVAGTATHYCPSNNQFYDCRLHPCCIPRPAKPAAPEWADGLPPVGCECEYKCNGVWGAVKVNAIGKHHILIEHLGVEVCRRIEDLDFRPIRTKEQMERDELIEIILTDGDLSAGMLSDVILSRYNLEPKP